MNIDTAQEILSSLMVILLICYVITTAIMYFAAKVRGYNPVGVHVKSSWDFNINLRFLSDLRKNYTAIGKTKIIPFINLISFYGVLLGMLIAIASEFLRYY